MKLLMLTHTYYPSIGGGIRYKKAIVSHLRSRGHTVDVLALNSGGKAETETQGNGRVYRASPQIVTGSSPISFTYLNQFRKTAGGYDVLLFNFPSPMEEIAQVIFGHRAAPTRKVVMYHADIVDARRFAGAYNRFITRPFLDDMDAIIVSSPRVRDSSPHLEPYKSRVQVIPFGIHLSKFGRPEPKPSKPDPQEVRTLFVGRMGRYKGVDVLLRAFREVPGRLRLVGDGALKDQMETLAVQNGLQGRAKFLGRISDEQLIEEYHNADILVLPSTDAGEAFGYVLVEAMAGRNAIVSTELGTGTSYVNKHGVTGLVVQPSSVSGLRDALTTLVAEHELRYRMQEAAYRRASDKFDIHRMLRENEAAITGDCG